MKKEADVKKRIKEILDDMDAWWFMYVPVGYGKSGIPDFLVCYWGCFVAIEAKFGGTKPTSLQYAQMDEITDAGGRVLVVDEHNVEKLRELIVDKCL
jgi:hypothetical protein